MKTEEPLLVSCRTHGKRPTGFICRHLNVSAVGLGFYKPDEEEGCPLQAWCHQCEQWIQEMDGLLGPQEIVDNFQTICDRCFSRVESRNLLREIDGQPVH